VAVAPPRGRFTVDPARPGEVVLIAGGIGITPLRAMLQALAARPGRAGRVVLHYLARGPEGLVWHDEFARLAASWPAFRYRPRVTGAAPEWAGARGRPGAAELVAELADPAAADYYLCAPVAMIDEICAALAGLGVPAARLHHEAFAAAAGAGSHTLHLPGGRSLTHAGAPSLLATLERAGCAPPSDCRSGECGQCLMRLVAGEVRYPLAPAAPIPPGLVLTCCAQPASDLRLAAA
jgi:ferredoxin-NADP reductase